MWKQVRLLGLAHPVGQGGLGLWGIWGPRFFPQQLLLEVHNETEIMATSYDKESGEGYKSVPLRHQNSDASQDALKLVPDSSF